MSATIPDTIADVSADWLEGEFRSEGVIGATDRILSVTVDELGEGVGMLGDLARVTITYEPPAAGPVECRRQTAHGRGRESQTRHGLRLLRA